MTEGLSEIEHRLRGLPYRNAIMEGLIRVSNAYSYRRTGATTALAMNTIAIAMQHPGTPILIIDSYPAQPAKEDLARRIHKVVESAGLQGFMIKNNPGTLTFKKINTEGLAL